MRICLLWLPACRPCRGSNINDVAGQVRMDQAPGRIGFMSTQRRESRSAPVTEKCRWGPRNLWQRTGGRNRGRLSGRRMPSPETRCFRVRLCGDASQADWQLTATPHSLQTDRSTIEILRPARRDIRRGSPPLRFIRRVVLRVTGHLRSSFPLVPIPPGFAPIHSTLPQAPAA